MLRGGEHSFLPVPETGIAFWNGDGGDTFRGVRVVCGSGYPSKDHSKPDRGGHLPEAAMADVRYHV